MIRILREPSVFTLTMTASLLTASCGQRFLAVRRWMGTPDCSSFVRLISTPASSRRSWADEWLLAHLVRILSKVRPVLNPDLLSLAPSYGGGPSLVSILASAPRGSSAGDPIADGLVRVARRFQPVLHEGALQGARPAEFSLGSEFGGGAQVSV